MSLLKCINQNIIAPAVKYIRILTSKRPVPLQYKVTLIPLYFFCFLSIQSKDVKGGWKVNIIATSSTVTIFHLKQVLQSSVNIPYSHFLFVHRSKMPRGTVTRLRISSSNGNSRSPLTRTPS